MAYLWHRALGILILVLSTWPTYPQTKTVVYKFPDGKDVVTYDSKRIELKSLNRWMKLSPTLSPYNGWLVPESIYLCKAYDPKYHNCGKNLSAEHRVDKANAEVTLHIISDRLRELQKDVYPKELQPVIQYFVHIQSWALASGEADFEYHQTGDIHNLERRLDVVDPAVSCKSEIDQIRNTASEKERASLIWSGWYNCVWNAEKAHIGEYPKAAWQSFLTKYGVSENVQEESPE